MVGVKQEKVKVRIGDYHQIDPEWKAKWLEALRGDKYTQCTDFLRQPSIDGEGYEYCALGVLVDIHSPEFWGEYTHFSCNTLPDSVAESVGMTARNSSKVSNMNDQFMDYADIADWIEEYL